MELNTILFRPPSCSYTSTRFGNELIWIPSGSEILIPSLLLHSHQPTHRTFLFFHANAEDLGKVYDFLDIMRCVLEINILAPEYPGYGLYRGKANCKNVLKDAKIIYDFMQESLNLRPDQIYLMGRSIGTGPASWLASQYGHALILISPYTSIRNAVKSMIGKLMQYLIKDSFQNIEYIKKVTCPVLFIHGKKDSLIPFKHTCRLAKASAGRTMVFLSDNMTHNKFEYYDDILAPVDRFLKEFEKEKEEDKKIISVPQELFITPQYILKQNELILEFL